MGYQLKFGGFTFPPGFHPAENNLSSVVPSAKLPRADGARQLAGMLDRKRLTVRGGIMRPIGTTGDIRTAEDALRAAINAGPQNLYFDTDRYWRNAQKTSASFSYAETGYGRILTAQIDFESGDPFSYDTTTNTTTQAIAGTATTWTVTPGGNAPAAPQWQFTIGTAGTLMATFTNSTTSEVFTLAGVVTAGQVIIVDTLNEAVTAAGVDKMALFDGLFARAFVGANNVSLAYVGGGATITSVACVWQNRFY